MKHKLSLAIAIATLTGCASQSTTHQATAPISAPTKSNIAVLAVPKPSEMVANVTTNGRVSTVIQVDVTNVGQQIPFTFSSGKVTNTPGFSWYVSKHFALKTDFPAERAAFFLRLLELSYPYYVEFFGMEPPNIHNQRIASTYATNNDKLRLAMFDDGFNRGIHDYAGGEAMYYNWVGYSFPTERPQHQRYIAIHETMHSYQMALGNYPWTPSWHGEGLGDATANHIFDSEKQQLTVFGHDVPIFDMMSWGLSSYDKESPTIEQIHNRKKFDRGLNVLFVQFMYNNPEYSQYMKIYNQQITALQTDSRSESLAVLKSVVPNWDALEADFKTWVGQIKQTHVVASRGQWEIDGNRFYKRESSYEYGAQRLDFNLTPAQQPQYSRYSIDFPLPDPSPLVKKAKRGVTEPVLGFELAFQPKQLNQGKLGIALAVKSTEKNSKAKQADYRLWKGADTKLDEQLTIEIDQGQTLVIGGQQISVESKNHPLPDDIKTSLGAQQSPKLGLSVQIQPTQLQLTLKTVNAQPFTVNLAVDDELRQKLLNRPFGLLSTDNQHGITPYIDDGRDLNPHTPDYQQQTAANAWGFAADKLAHRFARANFKAGKQTPTQWREAFDTLNRAALMPNESASMIAQVEQQLPELARAGQNLNEALAELSGIQLQLDWLGTSQDALAAHAIITNHGKSAINGDIVFNVAGSASQKFAVNAKPGERLEIAISPDLLSQGPKVTAEFDYHWQDIAIKQVLEQKSQKYTGFALTNLSTDFKDDKLTINAQVNGPFAGETKGTVTFDLHHDNKRQSVDVPLTIDPYQTLDLQQQFDMPEKSLTHSAWFEVTVVADSDGEPITLRKRLPIRPKKKAK